MGHRKGFVAAVLRRLGYPVPEEEKLLEAVRGAFADYKRTEGLDPNSMGYGVVPVDKSWIEETHNMVRALPSRSKC